MNNLGKVIHVVTSLDFGGVEKHMENIAFSCNNSVFEHSFIAITEGGSSEIKLRSLGFEVICLGKNSRIPSYAAVLSLFKLFKKVSPLVVHTHGAEANFHSLIAAQLAGVPVKIGEEIGIPNHSRKANLMFKFAYLFANKVIGISDAVTDWLIDNGEVPLDKAVRIYNPVVIPKPRIEDEVPTGRFRIGFIGRLEPVKNPLSLLEAVALIVDKGYDVELSVVGDGSQKQLLIDRANELKISDRVIIHGFQDVPDRFIRKCNVYVQPSISEGFGLALVEAMGCAVPVIATAVGGAPEIIQDNHTGWLIHKTDAETIANKLIEVLEMPEDKLFDIGLAGRKSIETRFEPAAYMKELELLYIQELNKVNH